MDSSQDVGGTTESHNSWDSLPVRASEQKPPPSRGNNHSPAGELPWWKYWENQCGLNLGRPLETFIRSASPKACPARPAAGAAPRPRWCGSLIVENLPMCRESTNAFFCVNRNLTRDRPDCRFLLPIVAGFYDILGLGKGAFYLIIGPRRRPPGLRNLTRDHPDSRMKDSVQNEGFCPE